MDPRIQIRIQTKKPWIRNTAWHSTFKMVYLTYMVMWAPLLAPSPCAHPALFAVGLFFLSNAKNKFTEVYKCFVRQKMFLHAECALKKCIFVSASTEVTFENILRMLSVR